MAAIKWLAAKCRECKAWSTMMPGCRQAQEQPVDFTPCSQSTQNEVRGAQGHRDDLWGLSQPLLASTNSEKQPWKIWKNINDR